MAIDKHISGAVEKFEDTAGTSHIINAEYLGGYDAREVFPNYGEVKTANRLSNKGYTGSATWYYPLLKLPVDNAGNYASAIVTGRIGGWVASNMSFCQFLIWNRDGEGITCLHMDGKGSTSEATNTADLVVYRNSDNTSTVYIKCNSYFTYDLNVQTYQSSATIVYNGKYSTTTPTGTLKVSGVNATTRLELSKNGAVYNGGALALKSDLTNYQPKGNYVTTDTAQTISAKKTFSATPALSAIKSKKVLGTDANGLIEAHTLGIDDITDLKTQLNGKQPSGAYAERQSAQTITGNWTFTGTTNFNGTTKVDGNEIASKGYVDGIFDSKLDASEATNFAKFTKFDSDTLKMTGARLYRTSAGDAVDRSSMYGYSSQNTYGTTYTRFAGMATIGSSQVFIGFYQYTKADGSNGEYIGNVTLSNGRLARVNGSLSSVNELTDAYAVLSDLNNKANKTHTHAISDVTNLQTSLDGKASKSDVDSMNSQITFLEKYTKVYYVDTNITTSDAHGTPINSKFESNAEMISSDMSTNFNTYPTNQCIYADRIGDVTPNELKVGDIIVIDGYLSRYVSDKTTVSTSSSGQASVIRVKFTAINKQYLDRINGKANASHTHSISQITNLQTTLDSKQNKITNPCSFDGSNGSYVKLIRTGTTNYYVYIQHGNVTYQGSTTQYPSVNVTFPQAFSGTPTVIVTFSPTSNSTGTYEALKVTNVTSTGFSVNTRMSANISAGYFRVNWIAIYTV